MGTRREVAVKPSYGTGQPGTWSNASDDVRPGQIEEANANGEVHDQARLKVRNQSAERPKLLWPAQSRLSRTPEVEVGSDAFVPTRSPRTSARPPHGGAQQAMVLSCESMAGQRHAGSA
jgi:hypothetical protein